MSYGLVAAMEEMQIFILQVVGAILRQHWFLLAVEFRFKFNLFITGDSRL